MRVSLAPKPLVPIVAALVLSTPAASAPRPDASPLVLRAPATPKGTKCAHYATARTPSGRWVLRCVRRVRGKADPALAPRIVVRPLR